MTDHGLPATSWHLEAAREKRLRAIVLPLLPKYEEYYWAYADEEEARGFGNIPYEEGDRIYLQEEWQEAKDMPPEAAQHWFAIVGVRVVQMQAIDSELQFTSGLIRSLPRGELTEEEKIAFASSRTSATMHKWNAAYPEHFWHSDRWVIVLNLEEVV